MTADTAETNGEPSWPSTVSLPASIVEAMIRHAQAEYPNEACGIVVGSAEVPHEGRALRFEPARNAAASPFRYEIDRSDLLRVALAADEGDEAIWGIYHSHTHTAARPSPTDIGLAFYPDAVYLLVSLSDAEADPKTGQPSVRAWRIQSGETVELAIDVLQPEAE